MAMTDSVAALATAHDERVAALAALDAVSADYETKRQASEAANTTFTNARAAYEADKAAFESELLG